MPFPDLYTMHLLIIGAVFAALALFLWQYCECAKSQRSEKDLQEKNQDLGCFAYAAAHDLKAPLRTIMQMAERLNAALEIHMTSDQKEDMILLSSRARRMDKLIDDLLEYWQAGRDVSLTHNDILSVHAIVHEILRLLSPADSFHIDVDPALSSIFLPRQPLQQVLFNLVGNAIKHHNSHEGRISIFVKTDIDFYTFCVSDNGPGVALAYRNKIFEMFETLKPRDEVEGSGMGLALARRIVERQEGSIHVDDSPMGGAAFYFTWPKKN